MLDVWSEVWIWDTFWLVFGLLFGILHHSMLDFLRELHIGFLVDAWCALCIRLFVRLTFGFKQMSADVWPDAWCYVWLMLGVMSGYLLHPRLDLLHDTCLC